MNFASFVRLLNSKIIPQERTNKKHIIRFRSKADYRQCMKAIQQAKSSLTKLSEVHPMSMINAICCSLDSCRELQSYRNLLVEEDIRLRVHGPVRRRSLGPSSGKPSPVPWGVREVRAPSVWRRTTGDSVRVAVIDTGIDPFHPDLRSSVGRGINIVQPGSPPYDDNGHGTHIAGTIAANNKLGLVGVAPQASIHAVKAFDRDGSAYVSDIIQGIDWCLRNDIHIINMSFGMSNHSKSLEEAVRHAVNSGVLVTASSGNEGKRGDIDYPARFPFCISVGATSRNKRPAKFSNRGARIDIYAPGHRIRSTWLNGGYRELNGTSMATSHVTGVIALLLGIRKGMGRNRILALLRNNSTLLKTKNGRVMKVGEVNAFRSVRALLHQGIIPQPPGGR